MKTLILAAALLQPAIPAAVQQPFAQQPYVKPFASLPAAQQPSVPHPSYMYSFDDVYRLTVAGAAMADFPAAAGPVRVAISPETRPQPDAGFSVREVPAPQGWLLVFAGLAAAFWVARRRLGYAL